MYSFNFNVNALVLFIFFMPFPRSHGPLESLHHGFLLPKHSACKSLHILLRQVFIFVCKLC